MDDVLIVTGGSRGIGAATALIAGRNGYAVCVNYLKNEEAAEKIVNEINSNGGRAIAVCADISLEEEVVDLFHFLISLSQVLGMSAEDIRDAYVKKNKVNHDRQESGYQSKDEADSRHI